MATPQGQLSERYSEELGTDRGFTGHEHLDHLGLVHMNARIYDPVIGRFLSADTVVQSPDNLQSHNRYSYVLNNPLSYSDPTGHFVFVLAAVVMFKFVTVHWAVQIAIVFVAGMADAYVQGARGSDMFRAGLSAAVTFAAAMGIGNALGHSMKGDPSEAVKNGKAMVDMGSRGAQEFTRAAAHGVTGGVASEIQGGDFGSGFASSFASSASGSALGVSGAEGSAWYGTTGNLEPQMITRTAIAAAVGGTVAEIGGGKFGNGATTAAIQHLVNAEGVENARRRLWREGNTTYVSEGVIREPVGSTRDTLGPDRASVYGILEAELQLVVAGKSTSASGWDTADSMTLLGVESVIVEYQFDFDVTYAVYEKITRYRPFWPTKVMKGEFIGYETRTETQYDYINYPTSIMPLGVLRRVNLHTLRNVQVPPHPSGGVTPSRFGKKDAPQYMYDRK